ncbi:DinB family protein [Micromonospora costi]|uniref:DinB family protein n=1 Tax=Micromonospora costi TaxID=1530042 RepID=A0A3B0A9S3_9ACTN|nr:DinB family protein [Micromonospora costi]RKN57538.1 DinB family protein [Micromonospora costi]
MSTEYARTDAFRGATFHLADLSGATFRECDLSGVRVVGSHVDDLRVSRQGEATGRVLVDDVDVTAFVAAELDRRHPERVQLRAVRTADDHRAMWATVERLWSEAVARAERLPEGTRHERVDGEWSFVETLRHLVFAIDSWVGRMILDEPAAHHRLGLPSTDCSAEIAATFGIAVDARPSYAEVLAAYDDRRAQVGRVVGSVTDEILTETRTATLDPAWGEETQLVGECLRVVWEEHVAHRRYALRDLARLEAR